MSLALQLSSRTTSLVVEGRELTVGPVARALTVVDVGRVGPQGPRGLTGPAGPAGVEYLHTQASASSTWTIAHNLGRQPVVEVRTVGGVVVIADVLHLSADVAQVYLASPMAGSARCT